ncbi:MAG TPA: hypothetical protein VJ546_03180 [Bacillales bacterium]|nr:hypothetical protein [Bacillales bacterium]
MKEQENLNEAFHQLHDQIIRIIVEEEEEEMIKEDLAEQETFEQ